MAFIRLETFALAANALAMAGTKLVDVFSIWSDTGLVRSSALAGCVAGYVPFSEAFAFTAIADSVVGSGTKFAIVAIAGEVVALAIISRDDLKIDLIQKIDPLKSDKLLTKCQTSFLKNEAKVMFKDTNV